MATYSLHDIARLIDHTNLHPDATYCDIRTLCKEARDNDFAMVAINQVQTKLCHEELKDSNVHVGAAISFPLGQTSIESKINETNDAIKNGATEIDYVINISEAKEHHWDYIKNEMNQIVSLCNDHKLISKVIFENCYLTTEEKIHLCSIANEVQPTFIKTSTGFGTSGATIDDVKLMRQHANDYVKVKASGGIRTASSLIDMLRAGATRIGTSAGIAIIEELRQTIFINGTNEITI